MCCLCGLALILDGSFMDSEKVEEEEEETQTSIFPVHSLSTYIYKHIWNLLYIKMTLKRGNVWYDYNILYCYILFQNIIGIMPSTCTCNM